MHPIVQQVVAILRTAAFYLASFPGLVDSKNNTADRQGLVLIVSGRGSGRGQDKSSDFIDDFLGLFVDKGSVGPSTYSPEQRAAMDKKPDKHPLIPSARPVLP